MIADDGQEPAGGEAVALEEARRAAIRNTAREREMFKDAKPWRGLIGLAGAAALAFGASAATPKAASAGGTLIWAMPAEMGLTTRTSRAAG
jgi:hypothetical protein